MGRWDCGGSVSNGVRTELSESVQFDVSLSGVDADILYTIGGGVGSSSVGGGPFVQVSVADNGISDLLGDGENTGTSIGPISADYSIADHARTYTYNTSRCSKSVTVPFEVHTSDTETYSLKESMKELGTEVKDEANKWGEKIIQEGLPQGNK